MVPASNSNSGTSGLAGDVNLSLPVGPKQPALPQQPSDDSVELATHDASAVTAEQTAGVAAAENSDDGAQPAPPQLVADSIATGVLFALVLTVVQKIVGFGRGILFCRFMTDQELGQWSMAWSALMLLVPLAVLGLPGCFGRFTEYYRNRGQLKSFIVRVGAISILTTSGLTMAMAFSPVWFSEFVFGSTELAHLVMVIAGTMVLVSISNFMSSLMESLRQVKVVTAMRFINGMVFAVAGTILIWQWDDKVMAASVSYGLACVVGIIPALWLMWKFRNSEFDQQAGDHLSHTDMWRRIAPFALWLWASNFCHNFFEVSDRYMLLHWSTQTSEIAQGLVGQYHSGRVVPLLLISVATMLGGMLMPYMSAHWENGRRDLAAKQLNWTIKLIALAFTAGSILVLMLSPLLFDVILEGRYNEGLRVLPLTLCYCIWFCLFVVGQDYLWVAEKGKWAAFAILVGLVVNIVMNMLLIPSLGLDGAVLATTIGNAVNVLIIYGFNHRFGCGSDRGVWICTATPLVLLLSPLTAAALTLVSIMVALRTSLFFSESEKQAIGESLENFTAKFARR